MPPTPSDTASTVDQPSAAFPWPIHQATLANGLRVVVSPDPSVPLAAVNLWYDVGSRHEPAGKHGFAHLFEHLMFEGSAHVAKGEHFGVIQAAGGAGINASTNGDRTNYYQTIPSGQLELALWMEADRMGSLALTQETLDNQREVVKNERRQSYDNKPYGSWTEAMAALTHPEGHPYHHTTIGSMAELNSAVLADFTGFYATYYAPDNAVLSVVGDVDPETVFGLAEKYFGRLEPRGSFPQPEGGELPRHYGEGKTVVRVEDVPSARSFLSHRIPVWGSEGFAAYEILAQITGRGRGSRLYRALVTEQNLAQAESAFLSAWGRGYFANVMMGSCAPRDGVTVEELNAAYVAVCDEVVSGGVTEAEVERARAVLTGDWLRELATVDGRADELGRHAQLLGSPAAVHTRFADLAAVTPADVRRAAAETLRADNRIVLTYLPEESAA